MQTGVTSSKELGLGASATAASLFTKDVLAAIDYDPKTEVPRIHGYERVNKQAIREEGAPPEYEPIYVAIPRDKWVEVEAAHDARRRVAERLSDLTPKPRVAVGWQTRRGKPQRAVIVEHETKRAKNGSINRRPAMAFEEFTDIVKDRVSDEITGKAGRGTAAETEVESIPVVTEQVKYTALHYDYDYEYRSNGVPAGSLVHNGDYHATVGPYMYDVNNAEWIFITAGHVSIESTNGKIYQNDPINDDFFADVNWFKTKKDGGFDASVLHNIQFGGSFEFAANSSDSYQGPTIDGIQSKSGLNDMGWNDTIYKQGISTGRTSGTVDTVGTDESSTYCSSSEGDSGGPYWVEKSSGGALISGIHTKGPESGPGKAYGTIMDVIVSEFDLSSL